MEEEASWGKSGEQKIEKESTSEIKRKKEKKKKKKWVAASTSEIRRLVY